MSNQADSSRSQKRPRTDSTANTSESSPVSLEALERDKDFWLEDGNIVLVAQNVGFRVYKGLLTKQSPVFQDLFSAREIRADESYDGAPVARLFDSPVDLRHLFQVLLPTNQDTTMKDSYDLESEFHTLSALIRLSHKYQIEDIERRALRALRALYPSDLDEFTVVDSRMDDPLLIYAIPAINLARLTGTPSILPAAFYHCAGMKGAVTEGFIREDGTTEYLCEADLARCIGGVGRLTAEDAARCLSLYSPIPLPSKWGCKSADRCLPILATANQTIFRAIRDGQACVEVLSGMDSHWTGKGLCPACVTHYEDEQEALRVQLWQRLPSIFGLQEEVPWWPNEPDQNS